jgi:hypothetical protein
MGIFKVFLSALLVFSFSSICQADSVVITFSDGKTQTVTLDAPVKSITTVKYLSAGDQAQAVPQSGSPASPQLHEEKQPEPQQTSAKPKVKFKWAAPINVQ